MKTRKHTGRGKGYGTLEKRGNVYIARWTADGRRFSQSTGTADRREAEKRLKELTAIFRMGDDVARADAMAGRLAGMKARLAAMEAARPALSLADAFRRWLESPERADTAGKARLAHCEYIWGLFRDYMKKAFPDVLEMRQVTREHTTGFYATICKRGLSNGTINLYVLTLRGMWRTLADDEKARLSCNPWERIKARPVVQARRRELTIDELRRIGQAVAGEMRLLFAIGLYTGLRLVDCALLKWDSVDLQRRVVSVIPRKTARHNIAVAIPMHGTLAAMLADIPPEARRGYVMPGIADRYTNHNGRFQQDLRCVFEKCGIETRMDAPTGQGTRARVAVGFHSLRHSFVSLMANGGAPLAVVQRIVGHKAALMTAHYYHESQTALQSAVAILPDFTHGLQA